MIVLERQRAFSSPSAITQHTQCVFNWKADCLLHLQSGFFKEIDLLMFPYIHHFYFHLLVHAISLHLVCSTCLSLSLSFFWFTISKRMLNIFSPCLSPSSWREDIYNPYKCHILLVCWITNF